MSSTTTLKLQNDAPEMVTFWLYDPATQKARDSKVAGNGGHTNIVIDVPGSRLIGAWYIGPSGASLYPSNEHPAWVTADMPDGGQNYIVVLGSGGISFNPQ